METEPRFLCMPDKAFYAYVEKVQADRSYYYVNPPPSSKINRRAARNTAKAKAAADIVATAVAKVNADINDVVDIFNNWNRKNQRRLPDLADIEF